MSTPRTTAVFTGASAGLGLEYARRFAADGHDLVLIARRRDKLETLAAELDKAHQTKTLILAEDLTQPGAPQRIFDSVSAAGRDVEFLVNNAGFGSNGAFADLAPDRELEVIQVNVPDLVQLNR